MPAVEVQAAILDQRYVYSRSGIPKNYPDKDPMDAFTNKTIHIPILMYHHVGPLPPDADKIRVGLTVSPENFASQVKWLSEQGYHSIALEDLYQYSRGNYRIPSKPIIFTFDDGYDDVFQYAVPVLKLNGYVGSFTIITGFVGKTEGTNVYADWQRIKEAKKDGMEIVSHTRDHFDGANSKYDEEYVRNNLKASVDDLKSHLGITADIIVYPFGHYNDRYIRIARDVGFKMGVTTLAGQNIDLGKLMEVPRVRVGGQEDLDTFRKIISGR